MIERPFLDYISERRQMVVQLDITNACNLSCSHCYHSHHSNKGGLGIEEWKSIVDQVESFLQKFSFDPRFIFCGGEPLISPLLKPLIKYLHSKFPKARFSVLTNGTIHRKSVLDFLSSYKVDFQVSLDGPNENRHDKVRGVGSFSKSVKGIRALKEIGASVSILSILSNRTSPWVSEFFENAARLGVDSQNFTRLIGQGQGSDLIDNKIDRVLTPLELRDSYKEIILRSYLSGVPTNKQQPLFALLDDSIQGNGLFGYDALIFDYKGNLKITSRTDYIVGNVLETPLEKLYLDHEVFKKLRDFEIDTCGNCHLVQKCGGDRNASFAAFGSFLKRDPGCWLNLKGMA